MEPSDAAVIWVSLAGSLLAAAGCAYAAIRIVSWQFGATLKLSLILSATLALAYSVSYIWLLDHPEDVEVWSRAMRPVGMLSWWLGPWLILPLSLIRQVLKLRTRMNEDAQALLKTSASCGACYDTFGRCPISNVGVRLPESCPLKPPESE